MEVFQMCIFHGVRLHPVKWQAFLALFGGVGLSVPPKEFDSIRTACNNSSQVTTNKGRKFAAMYLGTPIGETWTSTVFRT